MKVCKKTDAGITVKLPVKLNDFSEDKWIDLTEYFGPGHFALLRDDHIIVCLRESGCFCAHRRELRRLGNALLDVAGVWEDVRT